MSTNKEGKKPQYKDYVHFLETYRNGKKDESTDYSLTNSSNNSSSSINSDHLSDQTTRGFKEYLENYENKKFSSVKPSFLMKNNTDEKKTIKTEIFINITNEQKSVNNTHSNCNDLNKISSKKFEKNSNTTTANMVSSKVNKYNSQQNETESDGSEQKQISVEEISKKFQTNGNNTLETKRTTLKKQNSIKEKSKLFENNVNEINDIKHSTNGCVLKQNSFKQHSKMFTQESSVSVKPKIAFPPKPPAIKVELTQTLPNGEIDIDSKMIVFPTSSNKNSEPKIIQEAASSANSSSRSSCVSPVSKVSSSNCGLSQNNIPPPPPITNESQNNLIYNLPPPPPPLPQNNVKKESSFVTVDSTFSSPICLLPAVKAKDTNGAVGIPVPPPPPPPPSNCLVKINSASPINKARQNNSHKTNITGFNTLPRMQNNKPSDATDGIAAPSLDKNDPRVKKLVYSALRDMYGAYHNQANDYLATLPKNRVKKNNGLDSIINSIASQGGLDKLSGRANPKIETELTNN